ncbi:hypothetical protein LTS18_001034, partial [Coniosporium uncinatum]
MSHAAPNSGGAGAGVSTHSASRLQRSMLQIPLSSAARTPAMQATTNQEADGPMADTAAAYASQASNSTMPAPDTLPAPGGVSALSQQQQQQQQQSIPMLDMGVGASFADGDLIDEDMMNRSQDAPYRKQFNTDSASSSIPYIPPHSPDIQPFASPFERYLSLFVVTIKKSPYYPKADQSDLLTPTERAEQAAA